MMNMTQSHTNESVTTLWQQARVRAAILRRYFWRNPAAAVEFAIWIMALVVCCGLLAVGGAVSAHPRLVAMAALIVGGLMIRDALRYHWQEAVLCELKDLDQAMSMAQAGSRPAVR